ncbi:TPA: chitin-binding protein, partial [Candidatus Gracilibacteria bacterium]|nr:chitin-binding protein [Candidatus Gracilibacteria bacterium]
MTAGTPAVINLSGLTPSTAYKYYFVSKDAANNDQVAVSAGLAITTTATPDTTPPT